MASLKRCDKCGELKPFSEIKMEYHRRVSFEMHVENRNIRGRAAHVQLTLATGSMEPDICEPCMKTLFGIAEPIAERTDGEEG